MTLDSQWVYLAPEDKLLLGLLFYGAKLREKGDLLIIGSRVWPFENSMNCLSNRDLICVKHDGESFYWTLSPKGEILVSNNLLASLESEVA